jgi:hypothetical protein
MMKHTYPAGHTTSGSHAWEFPVHLPVTTGAKQQSATDLPFLFFATTVPGGHVISGSTPLGRPTISALPLHIPPTHTRHALARGSYTHKGDALRGERLSHSPVGQAFQPRPRFLMEYQSATSVASVRTQPGRSGPMMSVAGPTSSVCIHTHNINITA